MTCSLQELGPQEEASCSQFSSYRYFGFELSRNDTYTHIRFESECAGFKLKQLTLSSLSSNVLSCPKWPEFGLSNSPYLIQIL